MYKAIFIASILLSFNSCKNESTERVDQMEQLKVEKNQRNQGDCPDYIRERKLDNLNISIFIDLSNRIDNPTQKYNDSAYIRSLASVFNSHVRRKKLGLLYDKMEVFFDPTPSNQKINSLSEKLKISYVKGISKTEWMPKTIELYSNLPLEIYELATEDARKNGYPGSDIWGFMKYHVKDYSIDKCRRNILVILTDGYMFHEESKRKVGNRTSYLTPKSLDALGLNKNNWEEIIDSNNIGFITAAQGLGDLEVLVIGITNQNAKNPYSEDIIEKYWHSWLLDMGVKKIKIKKADIPSRIEKVISDFIEN